MANTPEFDGEVKTPKRARKDLKASSCQTTGAGWELCVHMFERRSRGKTRENVLPKTVNQRRNFGLRFLAQNRIWRAVVTWL